MAAGEQGLLRARAEKGGGDGIPRLTSHTHKERLGIRVADPVHFRPDPAPANQNFKIGSGSRILLALKESIQTSKFFPHQTYFF